MKQLKSPRPCIDFKSDIIEEEKKEEFAPHDNKPAKNPRTGTVVKGAF